METTTAVRRVAIIGTPPGLGLRPTLIASSPRFHAAPPQRPTPVKSVPAPVCHSRGRRRRGRRQVLGALVPQTA